MALDRPDDDFGSPERERPASDVPAARSEPVESRGRAEYYEVLRAAADDRTADKADEERDRGGWKEIDAADRPPVEGIRLSPERATHILDGDSTGTDVDFDILWDGQLLL